MDTDEVATTRGEQARELRTGDHSWARAAQARAPINTAVGGQCPARLATTRTRRAVATHDRPPQMTEPRTPQQPHCRPLPTPELAAPPRPRTTRPTSRYENQYVASTSRSIQTRPGLRLPPGRPGPRSPLRTPYEHLPNSIRYE